MDYLGFLEKGYGLLATKFKDYGLFVWHFKITDYWVIIALITLTFKGIKRS